MSEFRRMMWNSIPLKAENKPEISAYSVYTLEDQCEDFETRLSLIERYIKKCKWKRGGKDARHNHV